ncbi:MAG: hypothetical protein PHQ25_04655 [Acidobacteriota bacterium]|nr:hypothetical protein [Acidobacteriota bacterium]MDW3229722.1 hypothetical protein [Acidobacteriota bacterium]MDY0231665.1 hypothetical protein [Candidatus Saccharicenans sp.]
MISNGQAFCNFQYKVAKNSQAKNVEAIGFYSLCKAKTIHSRLQTMTRQEAYRLSEGPGGH